LVVDYDAVLAAVNEVGLGLASDNKVLLTEPIRIQMNKGWILQHVLSVMMY
jgi:hypothetical protein